MDDLSQEEIDAIENALGGKPKKRKEAPEYTPSCWRVIIELCLKDKIIKDIGTWEPNLERAKIVLAKYLAEGFHPKRCYIERLEIKNAGETIINRVIKLPTK